jgi:tRNA-splicing ligase RtcB
MVGKDIACGMLFFNTGIKLHPNEFKEPFVKVLKTIYDEIPMGMTRHKDAVDNLSAAVELSALAHPGDLPKIPDVLKKELIPSNVATQLGTLGGGNHFIELQKNTKNELCIMIHSGSRHVGTVICDAYHKIALDTNERYYSPLPDKELAFLPEESNAGQDYIKLMNFCISFSFCNRLILLKQLILILQEHLKVNKFNSIDSKALINIHHNYATKEEFKNGPHWIHRKGATSARLDKLGIIPGSMGTCSYIVKGKGNEQSIFSCSHGAGRVYSRTQAKATITRENFEKSMEKVLHSENMPLDEAPEAYKNIDTVMKQQKDLVSIVDKLTPIAVAKSNS